MIYLIHFRISTPLNQINSGLVYLIANIILRQKAILTDIEQFVNAMYHVRNQAIVASWACHYHLSIDLSWTQLAADKL